MLARAVCTTLALLSAGCAMSGQGGREFDLAAVERVKIGQTTTTEASAMLGEPLYRNVMPDGTETWSYHHALNKQTVGAQTFIPIVGPFLAGGSKGSQYAQTLVMTFDDAVLTNCQLTVTETSGEAPAAFAIGNPQTKGGSTVQTACGQ